MQTSIINNISAKQFWLKIRNAEKLACMTWSRSRAGWKKIITFNPVDIYDFKINDGQKSLHKFINKNKKNFIIGYFSYDVGYDLYNIQPKAEDELNLPGFYFLAYENYIEFKGNGAITRYKDNYFLRDVLRICDREITKFEKRKISNFNTKISRSDYKKNFERIIDYIKAGDIYQVNYTHQMSAETNMLPRNLFYHFLEKNPVDFAVYLESDDFAISSLSPERFVKIEGKKILSQPIKGTAKRGETTEEDNQNRKELLASEKEKAELFMITDLIRNDLGKICQVGSVKVVKKREVQKLPKVFHTFSKINGKLNNNVESIDALFSMFPGGSITGCPKKRAMQIIDEIEPQRRGVYTGSIGYILPGGDAEFNIAIRTIIQKKQKLYLGVGGGITIESKLENEFEETLIKAKSFLKD